MIKDLTEQRFGTLTAMEYVYSKNHAAYWRFICDCGEIWKTLNQSDISYGGFKDRLRKGMDIDEALIKRSLKGNGS